MLLPPLPRSFSPPSDAFINSGTWGEVQVKNGDSTIKVQYIKLVCDSGKTCNRGALVVTPGQSETIMKYKEILLRYQNMGFSPIFSIDHVGQGTSDRVNQNDHFMQHVNAKEQLIGAYSHFLNTILPTIPASKPRFLACHSMGCALSFAVLINDYEAARDTKFHAIVANAPLVKADTSPFPYRESEHSDGGERGERGRGREERGGAFFFPCSPLPPYSSQFYPIFSAISALLSSAPLCHSSSKTHGCILSNPGTPHYASRRHRNRNCHGRRRPRH